MIRYPQYGNKFITEAQARKWAAMYRKGMTTREIAATSDRSFMCVYVHLLGLGVKMRGTGRRKAQRNRP